MTVTLQSQISADEKAIRLLIGEKAALTSRIARARAHLKLEQAKLAARLGPQHPLSRASRFPDVSNNQPNINVGAIRHASGIRVGDLLVTKVTEGLGFVDHLGVERFAEMKKAGFPHRGGYSFLHPSSSGAAQAAFFLKQIGGQLTANDIVIADLEVTDGASGRQVAKCAADFADAIRPHFKGKLWLYGGGPFLHENGVTLKGYDGHWLAAYVSNPAPFKVFGSKTVAWQFTDGIHGPNPHACPGVGPCDLSIIL